VQHTCSHSCPEECIHAKEKVWQKWPHHKISVSSQHGIHAHVSFFILSDVYQERNPSFHNAQYIQSYDSIVVLQVFFTMGKMVNLSKYIIWKLSAHRPFSRAVPNSYVSFPILQYHFTFPIIRLYYPYDLWILPYYNLKKGQSKINLNRPFQLHTSHFSIGSTCRIVAP
jgi:hypothetical protein